MPWRWVPRRLAAPALAPPRDLSHAGAVVDKAIEYMIDQRIGSLAIASALLGGSLGLMARSMTDEAVLRVLENAITSVRAGELRAVATESDLAASRRTA